jgi:hypothetical protein
MPTRRPHQGLRQRIPVPAPRMGDGSFAATQRGLRYRHAASSGNHRPMDRASLALPGALDHLTPRRSLWLTTRYPAPRDTGVAFTIQVRWSMGSLTKSFLFWCLCSTWGCASEESGTEFTCTFSAVCSEGEDHNSSTATQTASLPVDEDTAFVWVLNNFVSDETEVRVTLRADGGLEYRGTEYSEVPDELQDSWVIDDGEGPAEDMPHVVHPRLSCKKVAHDDGA